MTTTITILYEDLATLQRDSADKAAVIALLKTEFPDDTCQLKAIKSVLGVEEEETPTEVVPEPEP